MSKKESIQKEIDRLERYARFYLNMILALLSGIVWSIYATLENKVNKDIMILTFIGIIILIFLALKIKIIDEKENELLKQLEKEN